MEGAYSLVFQLLSQTFLLMKVVKATKKYLNPATKVVVILYKLQVCGSLTFQLLCNNKNDGTDQLVLQLLESLLGYSLGFNHWVQSI